MLRAFLPCLTVFVALLSGLVACEPEEEPPALDPARITEVECLTEGETRCSGETFQTCRSGFWYIEDYCSTAGTCSYELGCVACDPLIGPICNGDEVRACTSEGELGSLLDTCEPGQCYFNHCVEEDCPPGTELIYVVDNDYRLLSFNPDDGLFTFDLRGNLNCPAGPTLPGWGTGMGSATPFSMSVDRSGQAWILYTSGEIFWVNTTNPESCTLAPWLSGTEAFELFGMGFVSNAPGSSEETLHVAGGTVSQMANHLTGRLGALNPYDMSFASIGSLTPSELGPELTGTGEAELFAYFPGIASSRVARIDRATGTNHQSWEIDPLPGALRAWAFAHWGGQYYIFVTWMDSFGVQTSQVHRFDRETGEVDVVLDDIPYVIVGAGVSTCAPTLVD